MTDRMQTASDLWPRRSVVWRDSPVVDQRAVQSPAAVIPTSQLNRPQWPLRSVASYAEQRPVSTTLFACLARRANSVAAATVRVYRTADKEPVPDHLLRQLLRSPNPEQSEAEFLAFIQTVADVAGFCPVEKVRSEAGRVVQLWPVRPDWCRPIPRDQAPPDWEYRVPGQPPTVIAAEDMLVYRPVPTLDRGATGLSLVSVALRQIGIERAMDDFTAALFQRGAVPMIALTYDSGYDAPDESEKEELREVYKSKYGGSGNWLEPVNMTGVKDVKRIGFDLDELAYNDLRGNTAAAICQVLGVPPILIGAPIGLDASTYSNYEQARRAFYEDIIVPVWAGLDGALTRGLVPEFGDDRVDLEFDTDAVPALERRFENERLLQFRLAFTSGPVFRVNELRAEWGYPPLDGVDSAIGESLYDPAWGATGGVTVTPVRAAPPTVQRRLAIEATRYEVRTIGEVERRYLPVTETRATAGEKARKRFTRLAKKFAPKLATFWREQGERVVDELGSRARAVAIARQQAVGLTTSPHWEEIRSSATSQLVTRDIAEPTVDWGGEADALRLLIGGLHERLGEEAWSDLIALLGADDMVDWDLSNPNIQAVLEELAQRVTDIAEVTRADVQRVVGKAIEAGETVDQLADRLKGLFEETYKDRALTVARTESQVAYNSASAVGYRESGLVDYVQLLDNPGHADQYGASDGLTCAQRDGLVVRLEDVGGHVAAEHPNGSLAIAPIVAGEE